MKLRIGMFHGMCDGVQLFLRRSKRLGKIKAWFFGRKPDRVILATAPPWQLVMPHEVIHGIQRHAEFLSDLQRAQLLLTIEQLYFF